MLGRAIRNKNLGQRADPRHDDIAYEYRRKIGAYLRELREGADMTQDEVARHLGMGHSAVSACELGRSTISPENYEKLAQLFGTDEREMGMFLLRYTNPWLYAMVFDDAGAKKALRLVPHRVGPDKG
jgi:transcriptional regulator with XRE-family HTH domain